MPIKRSMGDPRAVTATYTRNRKGSSHQKPKVPKCPDCHKEFPDNFAGQWVPCTCPASSVRLEV